MNARARPRKRLETAPNATRTSLTADDVEALRDAFAKIATIAVAAVRSLTNGTALAVADDADEEPPPKRAYERPLVPIASTAVTLDDVDAHPLMTWSPGDPLGKGERKVLVPVLERRPHGVTRAHLTLLTGYKKTTRDLCIRRLVRRGFVQVNAGVVFGTSAGAEALPVAPLPTGAALLSRMLRELPVGEGLTLNVYVSRYPASVRRELVGEELDYRKTTRDLNIRRLVVRTLLVPGNGRDLKASPDLFDGARS